MITSSKHVPRARCGASRGRLPMVVALFLACAAVGAAPKAELWQRWEKHSPGAAATVDHSMWDEFLGAHLGDKDGISVIDYGAVGNGARDLLNDYLAMLSQTDVDGLNRDEQRAFWINLYNALTVKVILDNYPVDSIRDISAGLFSSGPWDEKHFPVAGEQLSLNDIEHRILRPIWKDPRLHYAVNCASLGCPNLSLRAFTTTNTENMLEAGARAYVNHSRGASVASGRLVVSSIYEWFNADFGGSDEGVIAHLRKHANEPLKGSLAGVTAIADDRYDWSLNRP